MYSGVYTTSSRVRLHTWRLGLTALILKNCHLSPDDLLSPLAPRTSFLLFFPIRLVRPFTPPLRITSTPFPRRNEIAPFRTNFSAAFSVSLEPSMVFLRTRTTTEPHWPSWKSTGRLGPFAACLYSQIGIRRHEVAGICRRNFGENCLGVTNVDKGRHQGK